MLRASEISLCLRLDALHLELGVRWGENQSGSYILPE